MNDNNKFKKHPIELQNLKVLQLSLIVNGEKNQEELPKSGSFRLYHGCSDYNIDSKEIGVKIGIKIDSESDCSPFDLQVEIIGGFEVNPEKFDVKYVEDWAAKNAPLILYPYLREHVHSLTNRAGFEGLLLPLFEIPTFKAQQQHEK